MHSTDPAPGTVYLIHFDTPYRHARHYIGWTADLDARLEAHRSGHGSRLMQVITIAGITWQLARTWPGGRKRERALKDRHEAPRLCPLCTPGPRPVKTGRSSLIIVVAETVTVIPVPVRESPRERGVRMGEQFLGQRSGWTPDRLSEAFEYVTRPYREIPRHTDAQEEAFRVFTHLVTSQIDSLHLTAGDSASGRQS
jgi:predicted GIY-YIG superfamily endonuclease